MFHYLHMAEINFSHQPRSHGSVPFAGLHCFDGTGVEKWETKTHAVQSLWIHGCGFYVRFMNLKYLKLKFQTRGTKLKLKAHKFFVLANTYFLGTLGNLGEPCWLAREKVTDEVLCWRTWRWLDPSKSAINRGKWSSRLALMSKQKPTRILFYALSLSEKF